MVTVNCAPGSWTAKGLAVAVGPRTESLSTCQARKVGQHSSLVQRSEHYSVDPQHWHTSAPPQFARSTCTTGQMRMSKGPIQGDTCMGRTHRAGSCISCSTARCCATTRCFHGEFDPRGSGTYRGLDHEGSLCMRETCWHRVASLG